MNNRLFARLLAQWKLHRRGQPMEEQIIHVGGKISILVTEDSMEMLQDIEVPGAIPRNWMVSVGTVISMALTLDDLLQLSVVNFEDVKSKIILQISPDDEVEQ